MGEKNISGIIVLSVFPSRRGFGFSVFRGPSTVLDLGTRGFKDLKQKNTCGLAKVTELIEMYRPDVVVIEDYRGEGSRRCARIERLIRDIRELAGKKHIRVCSYSRSLIRQCFAEFNAWTKQEIAEAIGEAFPEFKSMVPRPLKIWEKEHPRMSMFDALSLGFTYFYFQTKSNAA